MCLISQSLKPFIAKKDLKVFKVLNKTDKGYVTPYRVQEVELGGLMCGNDKNYDEYNYGLDGYLCQVSIGEGYVHAAIRNVTNHKESNSICVVAYIPKGTKYYVDVEFEIDSTDLAFWDDKEHGWKTNPGDYTIMIGNSSRNISFSIPFKKL